MGVKIQAGITIKYFIKKEESKSIIKNLVATIVDKILKILDSNEHENLISTLQEFVIHFPEEVQPYSEQLIKQLIYKWNVNYKPNIP